MEEANLDHCKLTPEQVSSLFQTIVSTDQLRLRTLCVAFVKFRSVPEEILNKAAKRVDIRTEIFYIRDNLYSPFCVQRTMPPIKEIFHFRI